MKKFLKLTIGLAVLSVIGLLYGISIDTVDDMKEQKVYSYISLQVPNSEATMTFLKKVPESKCEKWREEYFEASLGNCTECIVLHNSCSTSIPNEYLAAFYKQKISTPYVYKAYKYPEVSIITGLPEGGFSQICETEKQQFSEAVCIN